MQGKDTLGRQAKAKSSGIDAEGTFLSPLVGTFLVLLSIT